MIDCEQIVAWMISSKGSIRQCSEAISMSKSKIFKYIHTYVPDLIPEAYSPICKILEWNSENRRKPRRLWVGEPDID